MPDLLTTFLASGFRVDLEYFFLTFCERSCTHLILDRSLAADVELRTVVIALVLVVVVTPPHGLGDVTVGPATFGLTVVPMVSLGEERSRRVTLGVLGFGDVIFGRVGELCVTGDLKAFGESTSLRKIRSLRLRLQSSFKKNGSSSSC